jgi:hypothetical protein
MIVGKYIRCSRKAIPIREFGRRAFTRRSCRRGLDRRRGFGIRLGFGRLGFGRFGIRLKFGIRFGIRLSIGFTIYYSEYK